MTKTILALALASLAMPAAAETWTLHRQGDWTVIYVGGDEPEQCLAGVGDEPNFTLSYDEHGFDGNVTDRRANWGRGGDASIDIWVDRQGYFTPPVSYAGDFFWFDITNSTFAEQLWHGRTLYIDTDRDGDADYWFSLQGSAGAMGAFLACVERMNLPMSRPAGAPA